MHSYIHIYLYIICNCVYVFVLFFSLVCFVYNARNVRVQSIENADNDKNCLCVCVVVFVDGALAFLCVNAWCFLRTREYHRTINLIYVARVLCS